MGYREYDERHHSQGPSGRTRHRSPSLLPVLDTPLWCSYDPSTTTTIIADDDDDARSAFLSTRGTRRTRAKWGNWWELPQPSSPTDATTQQQWWSTLPLPPGPSPYASVASGGWCKWSHPHLVVNGTSSISIIGSSSICSSTISSTYAWRSEC